MPVGSSRSEASGAPGAGFISQNKEAEEIQCCVIPHVLRSLDHLSAFLSPSRVFLRLFVELCTVRGVFSFKREGLGRMGYLHLDRNRKSLLFTSGLKLSKFGPRRDHSSHLLYHSDMSSLFSEQFITFWCNMF